MSNRPYLGSQYELVHSSAREYKKALAFKVRRGLTHGVPSDSNPLGLYQLVVTGYEDGQPRKSLVEYCMPYELPDENTIEASCLFENSLPPTKYDFAASLTFAAILRYAQLRRDLTSEDVQILNNTEMLNFTTVLTFRILGQIAKCAVQHLGANSVEEIAQICRSSYGSQVGILTKMWSHIAQSTEYQLGVSIPPDQFVNTQASFVIDNDQAIVGIGVNPIYVGQRTRCSGAVEDSNGNSYTKAQWNRGIQICSALPWLFQAELDQSK